MRDPEMNEAAKLNARTRDINPFLKYGETIELHPVFVAMKRARELAKATGTEPVEVIWDDSWPDLDHAGDDEEYWNGLIERNWETLSRWNATARDPSRKGKALTINVRDGIEIIEEVDIIWDTATK
jgi:hypothetical protein